jgi:toxin ParE1/3/4
VTDQRRIGRAIDEIRAGYFKLSVGSHFLCYRVTDLGIDIVRILHQRMDIPERLG